MKKLLIFAGNHKQATGFIRAHRFLNEENSEYCCQVEDIRLIDDGRFMLAGEFWLNPVYRSPVMSDFEQIGRLKELKTDEEVCEYLGVIYIPADLSISVGDNVGTGDGIV